jgi:hypothetical protein
MESGKKRSQRDYTLTFKLSVVDQVERASCKKIDLSPLLASFISASAGDRRRGRSLLRLIP